MSAPMARKANVRKTRNCIVDGSRTYGGRKSSSFKGGQLQVQSVHSLHRTLGLLASYVVLSRRPSSSGNATHQLMAVISPHPCCCRAPGLSRSRTCGFGE
jgi:hypothetical protein